MDKDTILRYRTQWLDLADEIFNFIVDKQLTKQFQPGQLLMKFYDKYPNFARSYPIVLAKMILENNYSREAFERFLKKLEVNPGKGMDGYNERQADYAKYLYMCTTPHPDMRVAKEIWQETYQMLDKQKRAVEESEKRARSEFDEEQKTFLAEKREEIRQFILDNRL